MPQSFSLPRQYSLLSSCHTADTFDIVFVEQHLATIFSVIIYAEFKSDTLQDASIFLSFRK